MINFQNRQDFITGSSLTNMTWEQVSQWYTQLVETDISSYLENPSEYQNEKNDKHLGTVCMFDPNFTSKYLSQSILTDQIGSAAICGTLGFDNNGRPSLWLQNTECIGLLWAKPSDTGTACNYTKIVLLQEKPEFRQGRVHAFPIENVQGYNALYFSEQLLKEEKGNSSSQWLAPAPSNQGMQTHEHNCTEDEDGRRQR